jgi:PAS domain S-box-containing protein
VNGEQVRAWRKDALRSHAKTASAGASGSPQRSCINSNPPAQLGFYWPLKGKYDPRRLARGLHAQGISLTLPVVIQKDPVPHNPIRRPGSSNGKECIMQPGLEHFSERLVSGMSEAVVLADATGLIQFWNPGAARMFGFTDTEALGHLLDIIIPESLRRASGNGYQATMQTAQSRYGEGHLLSVPAIRKNGARTSVDLTIVPFTGHAGQMIGIAAIMREGTTRFEELRALRKELATRPAPAGPAGGAT